MNDPALSVSNSISDFAGDVNYETNATTAFFFRDFPFDHLKKIRVTSMTKHIELNAQVMDWERDGPGHVLDFDYQVLYSVILDSRSNPYILAFLL